jgi:hypothetical protein
MRSRKTDLGEVLAVLNRARKMLGKRPIAAMPRGLLDSPDQNPITRALEADVSLGHDGDACEYCGIYRGASLRADAPKTARLLARAFGTGIDKDLKSGASVRLPLVLAAFAKDFEAQRWPELVDHDLVTVGDAARQLGCKAATIEDLVEAGLLEAKESCYEPVISISDLRRLKRAA